MFFFFFSLNGDTRNLHVRTPSSPSRRSSDPLSQSHTGAIAGNNAAIDAYFDANGVMRIEMLESLFEAAPLASRYAAARPQSRSTRSEEHTSELQSLMRISYAVFSLKKKTHTKEHTQNKHKPTLKHN